MPVHKTPEDYIDDLHAALQDHYSIKIPKRIVSSIVKQTQLSIIHTLKQGDQIDVHMQCSLSFGRPPYDTKKVFRTEIELSTDHI